MQKYQPFFRITSERDGVTQSYSFPETQFIAVTAYQNSKVSECMEASQTMTLNIN